MTRKTEPAHKQPTTRAEILAHTKEMVSLQEAAAYMRVDPKTIRRMIAAGKIPGYRVGKAIRVCVADLDALRIPVSAK